jgi:hypothetical protein
VDEQTDRVAQSFRKGVVDARYWGTRFLNISRTVTPELTVYAFSFWIVAGSIAISFTRSRRLEDKPQGD